MWTSEQATAAYRRANLNLTKGNYEDALRDFKLLMKPAPEAFDFFRGFQLSYVLLGWVRLAQLDPAARLALKDLLAERIKALAEAPGDNDLLYDISSISDAMKDL